MEKETTQQEQNIVQSKKLRRKYKIAAFLIFLSILCVLSNKLFLPDRARIYNDYVIREAAAKQLNKNIKDLQKALPELRIHESTYDAGELYL